MNYARWDDEELRRVLGANPKDIDAVMEAARRFESGKGDVEFAELQSSKDELESELNDIRAEAQSWREDYEDEKARAEELQARVDELEANGAGLV